MIRAVVKARRNGLLRLEPATGPTRFYCLTNKCAKCCNTLGSPVVTPAEAEKIGYQSIQKGKHGMFVKSQDSVCCLFRDGLCSIYSDRPSGCREYPWYNIDEQLYYDAGCLGIKHDKDERPNVDDIQPFEIFFPGTPKFVVWLIKRMCVER
ncbi:MAG: YkgJ family cysteine cluster protein [Planctomycetota bacterium]